MSKPSRLPSMLLALACLHGAPTLASTFTLSPVADGTVYSCMGCTTVFPNSYITVGGAAQGVVKFAAPDFVDDTADALLSVNIYQLPVFVSSISVFGYVTTQAALSLDDVNAGSLLGSFEVPAGIQQGQPIFLDVTSFVRSAGTGYLAFNLRADDAVLLSSLEFNRGQPAQLSVTTVPEPSTLLMWASGLIGLQLLRTGSSRLKSQRGDSAPNPGGRLALRQLARQPEH